MNFFCISNYNNDLDWVKNYSNPHLIYDKTWNGGWIDNEETQILPPSNLKEKYPSYNIAKGNYKGYNICDYMTFIIDHYDNLPDVTCFIKGNTVGRHVSQQYFDKVIQNKFFTAMIDLTQHDLNQTALQNGYVMLSCEGGWLEYNDSSYLKNPMCPTKYFNDYNDFLKFCFVNPTLPKYIQFPPGGNYIVPKEYILKYDKVFYENLRTFVKHHRISGEGQMVERALYSIWLCNFEVADTMKELVK